MEEEQTCFFYGAAKNRPRQKDKSNTHFGSVRRISLPIRDKPDRLRTTAGLPQVQRTNRTSACRAGYQRVPASLPEYSRSLRVALIPQCVQDNQALFPVMHIPGPHPWVPALGLRGAAEHAFSVSTHEVSPHQGELMQCSLGHTWKRTSLNPLPHSTRTERLPLLGASNHSKRLSTKSFRNSSTSRQLK